MTFKENPHPNQSESLPFLPQDYQPLKIDKKGNKKFGVISLINKELKIVYQKDIPSFGGYISREENVYGSPTYCPNATHYHRKHMEIYGEMPHLVFFDSEKTAKKVGFRKCKVCTK